MNLPNDLLSQFVKVTNDDKKKSRETTVYGTVVYDGKTYVRIDGSDHLTPVETAAAVEDGERVAVTIKDHTAVVTGNISSPAVRTGTVTDLTNDITEFESVMAYKVTAEDIQATNGIFETLIAKIASISDLRAEDIFALTAEIEKLKVKYAELDTVSAKDITVLTADIESLQAIFGTFTDLSTEDFEAVNAEIDKLKGYTADFTYVSADRLTAMKAEVRDLDVKKLSAEEAEIKYADIDFANIGKAAFEELYSRSGLIENINVGDGFVTGMLVGVTIKGDLIEGNTIVADKLVVKGSDGLYYKLNTQGVTMDSYADKYVKMGTIDNPENKQVYSYETTDGTIAYCTIEGNLYFAVQADRTGFVYVKLDVIEAPDTECEEMENTFTTTGEQIYTYLNAEEVVAHCVIIGGEYYEVVTEDVFRYTKIALMDTPPESDFVLIERGFTTCALVPGVFTTGGEQVYSYITQDGNTAYCVSIVDTYYDVQVERAGTKYVKGDPIEPPDGESSEIEGSFTTDGDQLYSYIDADGNVAYYTIIGEDYYSVFAEAMGVKLEQTEYNSLNGSIITAKSITAEQISVKDLVAFGATVGGFKMTHDSIYSGVKDSERNTTKGIYLDADGQVNIGDVDNFIRYVKNDDVYYAVQLNVDTEYVKTATVVIPETECELVEDAFTTDGDQVYSYVAANGGTAYCTIVEGSYALTISARDITYALDGAQRSLADLGNVGKYVKIGTYEGEPCIELGSESSDFKLVITNTRILFTEGSTIPAHISNQSLHIKKAVIEEEMRLGQFVWQIRQNGNMGLVWQDAIEEVRQ